ncbi:MAG: N-acetylmuramoyl-L-alanine amidase [Campylobacter sp.]|nr:N-acetylmuramoyl-L-alanine amidase [Campylobacter sp.]
MRATLKYILCLFAIFIILNSGEFDAKFDKFDDNFLAFELDGRKALHDEIKASFPKASSKDDKMGFLNRLIFSSKILGYEYSGYESELKNLGGDYESYRKMINSRHNERSSLLGSLKPTSNLQNLDKFGDIKNLELVSIADMGEFIELNFNKNIDGLVVNDFELKSSENFRYVIDIPSINKSKTSKISKKPFKDIRVGNYKDGITRVVLENSTSFSHTLHLQDNSLKIYTNFGSASPPPKKQTTKTVQKPQTSPLRNKTIVIDPGHGGKDPGAVGNGLKEKNLVLQIGLKLGNELKKRGYKVHYTRSTDKFIELRDRTKFANNKKADMFISIHMNAAPNKAKAKSFSGFETFFLSPARSERSKNAAALENKGSMEEMNYFSKQTFLNFLNREKIIASNKLAIDIQRYTLDNVSKKHKIKDGGVREAPFWVLVGALMPAVLIEAGYITHPTEGKNLANKDYQNAFVIGVANGIDAYFVKNQ